MAVGENQAEVQGWVDELDTILKGALERLIGSTLSADQRIQASLRLREGVCAFPSVRATASSAFLGSRALNLHEVTQLREL